MYLETIDPITGAIIVGILGILALYKCYILPGYLADKEKIDNPTDTQ